MRRLSAVYHGVMSEAVAVSMADGPATTPAERLGLLFDAHHRRLYQLARRLTSCREDACDLVQETYLRAAKALATIPDGASHEEAWLVRVLINVCRDAWRRTAVRRRLEPLRAREPAASSSNHEDAFVARSIIWDALSQLPPRRRAALILYELEGATIPAIARLLGVAPVTVRWHLSRGRRELARLVTGRDPIERNGFSRARKQEGQDGPEPEEGLEGQ
jgi:RNA polymerase sigma-70 factor (ECF subfamily)